MNTPKRTGTYCWLPQIRGAAAFAAVVRCKIRGVGWRGSLLLQTHKHCIQQQRSIGWLRCKKATAIQQKKHVVAECLDASWSLCQAGLLLLSVARFVCDVSFWFVTFGLLYSTLTMTNKRGDVFFCFVVPWVSRTLPVSNSKSTPSAANVTLLVVWGTDPSCFQL